jgi:T5SS/PEP-CTERM-associated repeat protein
MCKKIVYLVSFVLVLAFVSNTSAVEVTWTNSDPCDSLWSTPGNWNTMAVPLSSEEVHLSTIAIGPTIDSITAAVGTNMRGPGQGGATSMDIIGGSLALSGYWSIGHNEASNGTANVSDDATVTVGGSLYAGCHGSATLNVGEIGVGDNSTITVSGQTILSYSSLSVSGHVNLYSGLLDTYDLTGSATHDILIDIYEGTLIVRNKSGEGTMQGWIDGGFIVGYGGTGTVILEHDDVTGWDTLTAIPEPATIALLSLGGLALIRRKR